MDYCIYLMVSGSSFIILVLYVDGIWLARKDIGLLHETKRMLSETFEMKHLGEASFMLNIKIQRYVSRFIGFVSEDLH